MTAVSQFKSIPPASGVARHSLGYKIAWFFLNNGIIIALLFEILIFTLLAREKFFNINVFAIILQSAAAVGIIMPFYTMAMISGNVDFSTTQVGALAGTLFAVMLTYFNLPVWAAVGGALLLGVGVSALNSWVVIRLRIPSLIATLVSGSVCFGLAYLLAERFGTALQVKVNAPVIRSLWTIKPFDLPIPLVVYLMLLCYGIIYILLNHTRLGAHLYALGSNAEAAIRAGINVRRLIVLAFLLLALATSAANIIDNTRKLNAGPYLSPASLSSGAGIPITLVGALFAGIGLFGGTGRVEFTLIGILFFAVLAQGMAIVGFPAQFRVAVDGAAIILALILDSIRRYMSTR
jgi:ribose transport system permease protein